MSFDIFHPSGGGLGLAQLLPIKITLEALQLHGEKSREHFEPLVYKVHGHGLIVHINIDDGTRPNVMCHIRNVNSHLIVSIGNDCTVKGVINILASKFIYGQSWYMLNTNPIFVSQLPFSMILLSMEGRYTNMDAGKVLHDML